MTTQNLRDSIKAVLRGKFIAIQAYFREQEKHQINNLTLYLKQLVKEAGEKLLYTTGRPAWLMTYWMQRRVGGSRRRRYMSNYG